MSSRSAANGPLSLDGCAIAYEGSLAADPPIGKTPVTIALLVLRDQEIPLVAEFIPEGPSRRNDRSWLTDH